MWIISASYKPTPTVTKFAMQVRWHVQRQIHVWFNLAFKVTGVKMPYSTRKNRCRKIGSKYRHVERSKGCLLVHSCDDTSQKRHNFYTNMTTYPRSGLCYRKSACRLSVTFVRHSRGVETFGNISSPFCTLPLTSVQNFTKIDPGQPLHRWS